MKYLWIKVTSEIEDYTKHNLQPLMAQVITKCTAWRALHLTPVGRVSLVKMVFLPKFLYFFRNTPAYLPKTFFRRLQGVWVFFIWAGRPPRVAKHILYLPLSSGGLALPNSLIYYWAAVLVTMRWLFSQPRLNPAVTLEAGILGSYACPK